MKLTYFQSHCTADEAITIMAFLRELSEGIAASYREDIERWYCDMARAHAEQKRRITKDEEQLNARDNSIPF